MSFLGVNHLHAFLGTSLDVDIMKNYSDQLYLTCLMNSLILTEFLPLDWPLFMHIMLVTIHRNVFDFTPRKQNEIADDADKLLTLHDCITFAGLTSF